MADEELEQSGEQVEVEESGASRTPDYQKLYKREQRENRRLAKLMEVVTKFPGVSSEDLKGVEMDHLERIAERMAAKREAASEATQSPESAEQGSPSKEIPQEVRDAQKAFNAAGGGNAPVAEEKIPFAEAQRRFESGAWSWQDIQANASNIDGMKPPA